MVSADDVKKIAKLAALSVSPEEVERFTRELNSIFAHVEKLRTIDVSAVEPMSHVHGSINVFRQDKVSGQMDSEAALSNVPDRSGRFIRVPIIIAQ
jgi:aspartyl-tRNA(Asn)/glutamyl-tRNA(Gln) amidotransferase subunit C